MRRRARGGVPVRAQGEVRVCVEEDARDARVPRERRAVQRGVADHLGVLRVDFRAVAERARDLRRARQALFVGQGGAQGRGRGRTAASSPALHATHSAWLSRCCGEPRGGPHQKSVSSASSSFISASRSSKYVSTTTFMSTARPFPPASSPSMSSSSFSRLSSASDTVRSSDSSSKTRGRNASSLSLAPTAAEPPRNRVHRSATLRAHRCVMHTRRHGAAVPNGVPNLRAAAAHGLANAVALGATTVQGRKTSALPGPPQHSASSTTPAGAAVCRILPNVLPRFRQDMLATPPHFEPGSTS